MIEYKDIQIKYGDKVVVNHLNLRVEKGEFFTLLGASGCGKTTTLRALAGFLKPSEGDILVDGKSILNVPAEKRGIGLIFQNYALFPTMTVYENIAFGLKVKRMKKEQIKVEVERVADMVALTEEHLYKNISKLSGGQQQRVAIARALVNNPKILLLDEPLSNLDAKLRKQLRKDLKEMQEKFGITSVYVTHDQEEALALSDRIAVFHDGDIEQVGTPLELYNKAKTEYVCNFLGDISKLSLMVIKEINKKLGKQVLAENIMGYIRNEKIELERLFPEAVEMEVMVKSKEFLGSHSIYQLELLDSTIKCFVKEDGVRSLEVGAKSCIFLNPEYIMQYEGE